MARTVYISFDPYYEAQEYNNFLSAAKNNGIEYSEYLTVRAPYHWYVKLDINDVPRFINYDIITGSLEKFLVNKMKPRYPNEVYKLIRRNTDKPHDIERFVSPQPLIDARKEPYVCFFKVFNKNELIPISRKLGDTPLWQLGSKTERKGWIYFTTNKYIKSLIPNENILMEKEGKNDMSDVGELEYTLNYKHLVTERLDNKSMELERFQNGKFYPLKQTTFI